jgi:hypothetical protein
MTTYISFCVYYYKVLSDCASLTSSNEFKLWIFLVRLCVQGHFEKPPIQPVNKNKFSHRTNKLHVWRYVRNSCEKAQNISVG